MSQEEVNQILVNSKKLADKIKSEVKKIVPAMKKAQENLKKAL